MRVRVLQEGSKQGQYGYHFTNIKGFIGMLNDNKMQATNTPEKVTNMKPSWSITRKKDGMAYRGMSEMDSVRLVFDLDKINQRQRIVPFSHYSIKKGSNNYEYEERIIGDTNNILDYLIEVDFHPYLNKDNKIIGVTKTAQKDLESLFFLRDPNESFNNQIITRLENNKNILLKAEKDILPILINNDEDKLVKYFNELMKEDLDGAHLKINDMINNEGYYSIKDTIRRFKMYYEDIMGDHYKHLNNILNLSDNRVFSNKKDDIEHISTERNNIEKEIQKFKEKGVFDLNSLMKYLNDKGIKTDYKENSTVYLTSVKGKEKETVKNFKKQASEILSILNSCKPVYERYKNFKMPNFDAESITELYRKASIEFIQNEIKQFFAPIKSKTLSVLYSKGTNGKFIVFSSNTDMDKATLLCKSKLKNKTWKVAENFNSIITTVGKTNIFAQCLKMWTNSQNGKIGTKTLVNDVLVPFIERGNSAEFYVMIKNSLYIVLLTHKSIYSKLTIPELLIKIV